MSVCEDREYAVLYGYTKRKLTKITHNDFDYEFTFDGMGRAEKTIIAGTEYTTNSYTLTDTTTVETTYASGEKMTVETDRNQQPVKRTYTDANGNDTVIAEGEYDEVGKPTQIIDKTVNKQYNYIYDAVGNVTEEKINGTTFKECEYDEHNRLIKTTFHEDTGTKIYRPIYDKTDDDRIYADNTVVGVTLDGVFTHKAEHDEYGRVTEKNLTLANAENPIISDEITYIRSATRLTNMVSTVTQKLNGITQGTFSYTYDNNGNITEIYKNSVLIAKYTYDEMNQLVREDNYLLDKTYIFTYDTSGNILAKDTYNCVLTNNACCPNSTVEYTYASTGWKDQLVSFGDETITYDVLGNPITCRGHNLTWGKLRQLNSFDNNTFTYNAEGIRTSKNNITYILDGSKILAETRPTGTIQYLYGMHGVIGFTYNGNFYYYEKNVLNDVTAIIDANGTIKAKYIYDAWGNHTITLDTDGIGALNSIRYRSYYFDTETGLYYLQSRYYDPAVGRFINSDDVKYFGANQNLNSFNGYCYCANNFVIYLDSNGHFFTVALVIGAIVGLAVGFGATAYADYLDDGEVFNGSIDAVGYVANSLVGGVIGGAMGYFAPAVGTFLSSSFVIGTYTLAGGEAVAITISGTQILGAVLLESIILAFASGNRPGDNKKQNQQFRDAMRELDITNKDQMRRVHDKIKGRNMGYNELIEFIKEVLKIK